MTAKRTLAALIVLAGIATAASEANANPFKQFAGKSGISVNFGNGGISIGQPSCRPPSCRPICPPPVRRCVYCVYYLNCHHQWVFYGQYNSRWAAQQAQQHLQYQGKRTYIKVKHITGYPGGGFPQPGFGQP